MQCTPNPAWRIEETYRRYVRQPADFPHERSQATRLKVIENRLNVLEASLNLACA
jgi:hypothetical protein